MRSFACKLFPALKGRLNLGPIMRCRVLGKKDLHLAKVFQRPAESRLVNEK